MTIKKQRFLMSLVYNDKEIEISDAVNSVKHEMHNINGVIECDIKDLNHTSMSATITDKEVKESVINKDALLLFCETFGIEVENKDSLSSIRNAIGDM